MKTPGLAVMPLAGIGEVRAGDDLAAAIGAAMAAAGLGFEPGDVVVVAQKIVSKAEGRQVDLATVTPSREAEVLAGKTRKDARLVELILRESGEVMRAVPDVLIVRHRLGFVMANAGIDRSNIEVEEGAEHALLLPLDPDGSAAALREALGARFGPAPAVVISDSFGRAWRVGTVNVAIGAAGLPSLVDRRGETDRAGRVLESTEVALADALAAAAGLAMGEASEGVPVALIRGVAWSAPEAPASALVRPAAMDLFR